LVILFLNLYNILSFGGISLDSIIVEGYCRWKLSSGNLYTFIRPNHVGTAAKNASIYRSLTGIEPVASNHKFMYIILPCLGYG
jgi:hypothetical protein